ncbi:hypothetical protein CWI36_0117p0020 [Hamiltosporidium magnivora]|uniref:Uncharacterized protein n=1 Tax=Hamiltosporidium magnivora TaxID=148818 RepID=A0A4Q9LK43_9MICR|nr:hypothetical protein CWI36_0117p0020 [Hamiltosporidium magnivora]
MKKTFIFYFLFLKIERFIHCFADPENIIFPIGDLTDEEYLSEFNDHNKSILWYSVVPTKNIKNMLFYIKSEDRDVYYSIIRILFMRNDVNCRYIDVLLVSYILKISFLQKCNENANNETFNSETTKNSFLPIEKNKYVIMNYEKYVEVEICFLTYRRTLENSTSDFYDFKREKICKYNFRKSMLWFLKNNIDYILNDKKISEILSQDIFLAIYDCIFFIVMKNNENGLKTFNEDSLHGKIITDKHIKNFITRNVNIREFLDDLQKKLNDTNIIKSDDIPRNYIETIFLMNESYDIDISRIKEGRCFLAILNAASGLHESENFPLMDTLKIYLIKIYNEILDQRLLYLNTTNAEYIQSKCWSRLEGEKILKQKDDLSSENLEFIKIIESTFKIFNKFLIKYNICHNIYQDTVLKPEIINSYVILKSFFLNSLQNYEKTAEELKNSHSKKYLDVIIDFVNNFTGESGLKLKLECEEIFLISLKTLVCLYNSKKEIKFFDSKEITRLMTFYNTVKIKNISDSQEIENMIKQINKKIDLSKREKFKSNSEEFMACMFIENILTKFLEYLNSSNIKQSKNHINDCRESASLNFSNINQKKMLKASFLKNDINYSDKMHQGGINSSNINQNMIKVYGNSIEMLNDNFDGGPISRTLFKSTSYIEPELNVWKEKRNEDMDTLSNITNNGAIDMEISMASEKDLIFIKQKYLPCKFIYTNRFSLRHSNAGNFSREENNILFSTEFKCTLIDFVFLSSENSVAKETEIIFENQWRRYFEKKIKETTQRIFKISKTCDLSRRQTEGYIFEYEIDADYFNFDFQRSKGESIIKITDTNLSDYSANIFDFKNAIDLKVLEVIKLIETAIDEFFEDLEHFTIIELVEFIKKYYVKMGYSIQDSNKSVSFYTDSNIESTVFGLENGSHTISDSEYNMSNHLESNLYQTIFSNKESEFMAKDVDKSSPYDKFTSDKISNILERSPALFHDSKNSQDFFCLTSTQNQNVKFAKFEFKDCSSIEDSENENSFFELCNLKSNSIYNSGTTSKNDQAEIISNRSTENFLRTHNSINTEKQIESSINNNISLNAGKINTKLMHDHSGQDSNDHTIYTTRDKDVLLSKNFLISHSNFEKKSNLPNDKDLNRYSKRNLSHMEERSDLKNGNYGKNRTSSRFYNNILNHKKQSKRKWEGNKTHTSNGSEISVFSLENHGLNLNGTNTLERQKDIIHPQDVDFLNFNGTNNSGGMDDNFESVSNNSSISNRANSSGEMDDGFVLVSDNSSISNRANSSEIDDNISLKEDKNLGSYEPNRLLKTSRFSRKNVNIENPFESTNVIEETSNREFHDNNLFSDSEIDNNLLSRINISGFNKSDLSRDSANEYIASKEKTLRSFRNMHDGNKYSKRSENSKENHSSSDCYASSIYSNYTSYREEFENNNTRNNAHVPNRKLPSRKLSQRFKISNKITNIPHKGLNTLKKKRRRYENKTNSYSSLEADREISKVFREALNVEKVRNRNKKLLHILYFINNMLFIALILTLFWYFFIKEKI